MNELFQRRRGLMAAKANPVGDIIYGSRLRWEQGTLDETTGDVDPESQYSAYRIYTPDYIDVTSVSGKAFTYSGAIKDENDDLFFSYMYQYAADKTFLARNYLLANNAAPIRFAKIDPNCKFVRFVFGHGNASGVLTVPADGANAIYNIVSVVQGLVDGTFAGGSSSFTVEDNVVQVNSFAVNAANKVQIQARYPFDYKSGDTVRILIKKKSGTLSGYQGCDIWVGGQIIVDNKLWDTGTTALDKSLAVSNDATNAIIQFGARATVPTWTDYTFTIQIFVNGDQVLPEV